MSRALLLANGVMAVLFLISAGLQYNDPDPLRWAAIYTGAAAACLQVGRHRRDAILPLVVLIAALVWIGTMAPTMLREVRLGDVFKSMDDKGGAAELAREFGGLVIVAGWMAFVAFRARRARR
jgi:hypothetical protein